MRLVGLLAVPVALVLAVGCQQPAASLSPALPPTPVSIAFKGNIDTKFVGKWETAKGNAGLELKKDGSGVITSQNPSPRGIVKNKLEGKWLVSGGGLILRYTVGHQPETTVKYPVKLSENELTLQEGSRSKVVYVRK